MRRNYKLNVIFITVIIILMLVFAWWASEQVYDPKPTDPPPTYWPTRVTATSGAHPSATPSPIAEVTHTVPVIPSSTDVPTSTSTTVVVPTVTVVPTRTLIPYIIVEDKEPDCEMYIFKNGRYICYPYCRELIP